jgi:hypothetical protein
MADSPFLKFQDTDRDGLIDVCDDDLNTPEMPCKGPCIPDPMSVIVNWKKTSILEPFLNTKICHYQVTKVTQYQTTAEASVINSGNEELINRALEDKFKEFEDEAINSLLDSLGRLNDETTRKQVRAAIEYKKWDLPARHKSQLKLLYSVPFDVLYYLPDAILDEEVEEDEDSPGWIKETYKADSLMTQAIKVRKGLGLYGRMLQVSRQIGEGNCYFINETTGLPEVVFRLDDYGDLGWTAKESIMSNLVNQLKLFLQSKGFALPDGGANGDPFGVIFKDKVTKLKFSFKDYELRVLRVWSVECKDKPTVYTKTSGSLRFLVDSGPWKDKTAVAYFANLQKMATALNSRVAIPWKEFIEEYTYPPVKFAFQPMDETISSCITKNLMEEANEFGNDVLNEIFGLGDLIAYLYNDSLCRDKLKDLLKDEKTFGQANPDEEDSQFQREVAAVLARNQKFKKIRPDDDVVIRLCVGAFSGISDGVHQGISDWNSDIPPPQGTTKGGKNAVPSGLFKEALHSLKLCGLIDFMLDAMGCLLGGLDFEEAMAKMLQSALEAMGIENFGEMFVGLPPEKQREMDALVDRKLNEALNRKDPPGDQYSEGASEEYAQKEEGMIINGNRTKAVAWYKPWEREDVIVSERMNTSPANLGNYESPMPPSFETTAAGRAPDRTFLSQQDSKSSSSNVAPLESIMNAYIEALIEVYSEDLLSLIDELNRLPGAPLIRDILSLTTCPRPPLFTPGLDSFLKGFGLKFCREVREITVPDFPAVKLEIKAIFGDIKGALFRVARFVAGMIVIIVVNTLIAKVCQILSDAVCKALETTGDLAMGLPGAITGNGPPLTEIFKESICGPDADEASIEEAILDMLSMLALGPAAFADRDRTIAFANDLSLVVTRQEFADALLDNPSEEFLEAVDQLLEFEHVEFREALPNRQSIARFASNIGSFLPLDFRETLIGYSENSLGIDEMIPANPSICATPEQIATFKELRCEIFGGRMSKEQCEKLFCDLRDDTLQDLGDLTEILERGVGPYVADKIPTTISEPGCNDGLLPFETPQMINATTGYLNGALDALKSDYLDDMFGSGFTLFGSGDRNFGFLNMVLCDTMGNPLTAHHRRASNTNKYVDFAANLPNGGTNSTGFWSFFQGNKDFGQQRGQYPYYVGEWLRRQFLNAAGETGRLRPGWNQIEDAGTDLSKDFIFKSTNRAIDKKKYEVDLDDLGYSNLYGNAGVATYQLPDFGYNTIVTGVEGSRAADILLTDASPGSMGDALGRRMVIERLPRKGTPDGKAIGNGGGANGADIVLDFKDNLAGTRSKKLKFGSNEGGNEWGYGFEVQCYYSDIETTPGRGEMEGVLRNRPDDNIRVQIVEKVNFGADRKFISPMSKELVAEANKLPPFDLPDWIERIPVVGWALEGLIKMIIWPFSAVFAGIAARRSFNKSQKIIRSRAYEFIAVDDGLDAFANPDDGGAEADPDKIKSLNLADYQQYAGTRSSLKMLPPQVYMLADLTGQRASTALKSEYDEVMQELYTEVAGMIGNNDVGWLYGANYDFLTDSDSDYGVEIDGEFVMYDQTGYEEEDMVLGISRNQYNLGLENARVIYLNPTVFGGKFTSPTIYIKPQKYTGWWGFVQAFFPDDTACKPHGKDMIDFDEIQEMVNKHYSTLEDDERAYQDLECIRQVPFDRIMPRAAKMGMYTLVLGAIRIYAATHIMKSLGTFATIQPKFPDNFSTVFSAYIAERMEEDFKEAQPAFWEAFNTFKDEEFWYGFLEQSVQCYDFLVNAGEIDAPVANGKIQRAADAINDLQESFAFTYKTEHERTFTDRYDNEITQKTPGLWEAKLIGDADFFDTLKSYREKKNFEGIKSAEDSAKLILHQLINYELTKIGTRFVKNMRTQGFNPQIFDLDYWIFENKCAGSTIKYAGPEIVEVPISVPSKLNPDPAGTGKTFPGPYYTGGGQFRVAVDENKADEYEYSDEYVGYYHIHMDDDGNEIYMAGPVHGDEPHDLIVPVADIVGMATVGYEVSRYDVEDESADATLGTTVSENIVPIGDVPEYGSAPAGGADQPYTIEKYIRLNNRKYSTIEAESLIHSEDPDLRISDLYRGTLELILREDGVPVGIEGQLGCRHGLEFSYMGTPITTVEVDALDFKTSQFQRMQPNSKLLHCLLQKLKNDPKYKLMTSYIFSMKKVTGTMAIYNDMGFLASVGEITPGEGDYTKNVKISKRNGKPAENRKNQGRRLSPNDRSDWLNNSESEVVRAKPGSRIFIHQTSTIETTELTEKYKDMNSIPSWYDDDVEEEILSYDESKSGVTGNEGWAHASDQTAFTPFSLTWNEWDRVLLRNSRARIKKLFRQHYYSATRKPGDKERYESPAKIKLKNLKARLFPGPGAGLLPWYKRRKLRDNPYNADGEMCDGPDILG